MRYLTLNIAENTQLSIDNSMTGVETIYMNEKIVSKKFSFWGAKHIFNREENGEYVNYEVKIGLNFTGIGYNIYRNNEPILLSNNVSKLNNFSWIDVVAYFILFIASAALGYTAVRGLLNENYSLLKAIPPFITFCVFSFYFFWRKNKNMTQ
jgi:hypothetical protein